MSNLLTDIEQAKDNIQVWKTWSYCQLIGCPHSHLSTVRHSLTKSYNPQPVQMTPTIGIKKSILSSSWIVESVTLSRNRDAATEFSKSQKIAKAYSYTLSFSILHNELTDIARCGEIQEWAQGKKKKQPEVKILGDYCWRKYNIPPPQKKTCIENLRSPIPGK